MAELDPRIVITRENIYPSITYKPNVPPIERVMGFDPSGKAYTRGYFGGRLIELDRKNPNDDQLFREKLELRRKQGGGSGLEGVNATIADVEDVYNRRLASSSREKAVLGEAVALAADGGVRVKSGDVAVWVEFRLQESEEAYLVYKGNNGVTCYEEV